jgi:DNA-binding transcriptional MerR regulator
MEYRIEDLARTAGVAVDTVRFYQGRGLLPPPRRDGRVTWYGEPHLDRLQRIRALQQRGFTLAVIRRFLEGELEPSDEALVAALTAPAAAEDESISLDDLSARSGIPAAVLSALVQAEILVPVGDGQADGLLFRSSDAQALAAGMKLLEAGIPLQELLGLATDHARGVASTARRAVELFDHHVRERLQREGSDVDVSARLIQLFEELLDASAFLVEHHFRRSLLRAAREHVERAQGVAADAGSSA